MSGIPASRRSRPVARGAGRLCVLEVLVLLGSSSVFGAPATHKVPQPRPQPRPQPKTQPWEKGVSEKTQIEAERLLKRGKSLFYSCRITKARGVFEGALRLWNHPIIEHALALALVAMGRNTEAYHHLKSALRYGAAPFDAKIHTDAVRQLQRLNKRIARLQISCHQPSVEVYLNGTRIQGCPGTLTRIVDPGRHQIVAKKPGFLPLTRTVGAFAGQRTKLDLKLMPLPKTMVYRRRWPTWVPWTVLGVGVAMAVAGIPMIRESVRLADRFDSWVLTHCLPTPCTAIPTEVENRKGESRALMGSAVGLFVLGGSAVVAGIILAVKNRLTHVPQETTTGSSVQLNPQLGRNGAGLQLTLKF